MSDKNHTVKYSLSECDICGSHMHWTCPCCGVSQIDYVPPDEVGDELECNECPGEFEVTALLGFLWWKKLEVRQTQ